MDNLDESRPQPTQTSLLERLVQSSGFIIAAFVVYLVLITIYWASIQGVLAPLLAIPLVTSGVLYGLVATVPLVITTIVNAVTRTNRTGIPALRDLKTIQEIVQVVFVLVIFTFIATLIFNLRQNLSESGLVINFNVVARTFGTEVSEGPSPGAEWAWISQIPVVGETLSQLALIQPDTYFRALTVGFINTLRVVWLSLVASTVLGVLLGIGLLSGNWLVRNASFGWVEIFRNTPLLVQLFFIYNGVIRLLPARPGDAITLPGPVYISSRGLYYPALTGTPTSDFFWWTVVLGFVVGLLVWRWRGHIHETTGAPARGPRYLAGTVLAFTVVAYVIALLMGANPIAFEPPAANNFNFSGGASLSGEYLGVFLGLTFYTSAFIADIVRAGIQSVAKGQVEAARALGLSGGQTLSRVVLPQALRLAVPPLTNQYLNLAKNSSLGVAIGFAELFTVGNIAINQSGQAIVIFVIFMVAYLALSLFISLVMNLFNNSLRLQTR